MVSPRRLAMAPLVSLLSRFGDTGCGTPSVLGFPTWYKYLPTESINGACHINVNLSQNPAQLWLIGLAFVDILLRIGVLVAIGFVIYGGFQYTLSQGEPDRTAAARNTIVNSLVGLGISVLATVIVAFVGSTFIGNTSTSTIPQVTDTGSAIAKVLHFVFGLAGAIAVLMVVIGGFQYVLSNGDPQRAAKARNTIIYALVGLAISLSAFLIVSFVIGKL